MDSLFYGIRKMV